ncbi:zinc-dependent metalloprotease [Aquimarina sp. Aq78]|uniref:zinc-dependent metalloprotease n=1 Tax=Aquimarina sp. Aq78 TaxID=1191889 RepID=UPI000D104EAE|nr:zinc-dependent metalloprotease [Aquimarina sp. Aq78]
MKTFLKNLIVVIALLAISKIQAQTFCFTPSESFNQNAYASALRSAKVADSYCLRLYVHVIRRSNATGGQSVAQTNQAIDILNQDFNPHGVSFAWDNVIDYIDNDTYYSSPTTAIYSVNNHTDGIDVYIFDDASSAGGRANGVGESSEFWVSGSYWKAPFGSLVRSSVISHEMGHVLFLWHTHHGTVNEGGSDTGQCAELVNGSNGTTCGDYVADTPADPHLRFNVNHPACTWTSSGTDANGDSYNPNERIIMAYTHPDCMSLFTAGQGQRIRNAIATLTHLKNAVVDCGNNCPENLTVTQNVPSGTTDIQKASNTLTATNTIANGGIATYTGGQKLVLKSGFRAKNGSRFTAKIEDCNTSRTEIAIHPEKEVVLETTQTSSAVAGKTLFKLHPNPADNTFTVSLDGVLSKEEVSIKVYNTIGILQVHKKVLSRNSEINVNSLAEGLYYVIVDDNQGKIYSKKLLIKR